MKERFKIIPACYLVLIKEKNILLLRRCNTGFQDGNYSLPAGHLDGNETFREAMVREAKEEIGISIKKDDLEIVHVMHRSKLGNNGERIDIFLSVDNWEGEIVNNEPNKCDELSWFALENLPQNTIPYTKQAIDCIQNKIIYSESGF